MEGPKQKICPHCMASIPRRASYCMYCRQKVRSALGWVGFVFLQVPLAILGFIILVLIIKRI
jgi:hypothetical protein